MRQGEKGKSRVRGGGCADGYTLVAPRNAELAGKLGITTEARNAFYVLSVGGAGPSGLTAALYAAREGMSVLVVATAAVAALALVRGAKPAVLREAG